MSSAALAVELGSFMNAKSFASEMQKISVSPIVGDQVS